MSLRDRVIAFVPLLVLTVATAGAASLGLRGGSAPGITATDWPNAVRQLLDAPGAEFSYVSRNLVCSDPANANLCAGSTRAVRESGSIRFSPTGYDSVRAFEGAGLSGNGFAFRRSGDQEYVRLDRCWTVTPAASSAVAPALVLLGLADPAVEAPAAEVLDLLGVPRQLWEHYGFSEELRSALTTMSLPVAWKVDAGDLVIVLDGPALARQVAAAFPAETIALSHIAGQEAEWRATPLAEEPTIRSPGGTCID